MNLESIISFSHRFSENNTPNKQSTSLAGKLLSASEIYQAHTSIDTIYFGAMQTDLEVCVIIYLHDIAAFIPTVFRH